MGWIIFSGVLVLLAALVQCSVVLYIDYDKELTLKLGYLVFRYPLDPDQAAKQAEKGKTPAPAQKKRGKGAKHNAQPPEEEKNPLETAELILTIIKGSTKGLGILLRALRVEKLKLSAVVGGEDPAAVGISFGSTCAVVYGAYACLSSFIQVKAQRIHIAPDFSAKTSSWQFSCRIKLRVRTILRAAAVTFCRTFIRLVKRRSANREGPQPDRAPANHR